MGAVPGEVTLLFIAPEHAGNGHAKLLFEHGLSVAGAPRKAVEVIATKNSVSFYAKYGFKKVGTQAFERGPHSLQYPVVAMLLAPQRTDA